VASRGSFTRSAARATFSAYRRLPIRWRLAGGSTVLTFVILAAFAAIVDVKTTTYVRGNFDNEVTASSNKLHSGLKLSWDAATQSLDCGSSAFHLREFASADGGEIRIFDAATRALLCTQNLVVGMGAHVPPLTPALRMPSRDGTYTELGYRVVAFRLGLAPARRAKLSYDRPLSQAIVLYARPLSQIDPTLDHVRLFLLLGVLGGTFLALLAGLATAQRAMRPVVELSDAAREIERTRDPNRRIPHPEADDEVAELARTLEGMLGALGAARNESEASLARQREFVADASHELRTPLTSVLANLELLAEELDGEQAETAHAALRSTRRMRRLVGDLLLLARADAERVQPHRSTDLASVLTDAAGELWPVSDDHELSIDAEPAVVDGVRDDLHRLALNLLENAVRHTPPGTRVLARTATVDGHAELVVEDDGPGIPAELRENLFERFVRGGRDGGRGSGLGLAIVRAVATSHGGTVLLETPERGGTRFVITIPKAGTREVDALAPAQTSTTTGSTIGRRRNRS
jgi:two-component system OmpR family sensor kinase